MKQFTQKITAIVSTILIAMTLVGLNANQAIAQGKGRKGAKVRAGSAARIAPTTGSSKNAVTAPFIPTTGLATAARAEAFTVDMGTVEKVRLQAARTRRKTTKRTRQ